MGRMTAYDQNGRMVADFDKSDYDFLIRYGRMPEEVLEENAKLRELVDYMTPIALYAASERERDRMRQLGAEVDS